MFEDLISQLEPYIREGRIGLALSLMAKHAPELLLHKHHANFAAVITTMGTLFKNEQELAYLNVFEADVTKVKFSRYIEELKLSQSDPDWNQQLNNVTMAFDFLKVNETTSIEQLVTLYPYLSFVHWQPLIKRLLDHSMINKATMVAFQDYVLERYNFNLLLELGAVSSLQHDVHLNPTYVLLEKHTPNFNELIAERYRSTDYPSPFAAITAEPIPVTINNELVKWTDFFLEIFRVVGFSHQLLKELYAFDKRVWILVVEAFLNRGEEVTPRVKDLLISILTIDPLCLKKIYQHVSSETFQEIIHTIIVKNQEIFTADELYAFNQYVLSGYNLVIFRFIENLLTNFYAQAPLPPLSLHQIKTIELLERCSLPTRTKLQQLMQQLTHGFGKIRPEYDGTVATFVLAVIRQDKLNKYQYAPTLVNEENFLDYLAILFEKHTDVHEFFIRTPLLMTDHWRSGEIEINNGSMKLFISNSLGGDEDELIEDIAERFLGGDEDEDEDELTADIAERFPEQQITVYYNETLRQSSELGCSVFSLDDVRHLQTFTQYTEKGLFDQLDQRIIDEDTIDGIRVLCCTLPATLMRAMQSRKILEMLGDEADDIVTKPKSINGHLAERGLTIKESVDSGFVLDTQTGKTQNRRMDHKVQKMWLRLDRYIVENLYEDPDVGFRSLEKLAREHTFPAFQRKALKQHSSSGLQEQLSHTFLGKRPLRTDPDDNISSDTSHDSHRSRKDDDEDIFTYKPRV